MLFQEIVFSVNSEDDVINLVDIEEPWCSRCFSHTDYKRKWDSLPRANLDGGTYSEISESPYCVDCGEVMHYLSTCRVVVWVVRALCVFLLTALTLFCFLLFEPSLYSAIFWFVGFLFIYFLSKSPRSSRRALSTHRFYLEKKRLTGQP